MKGTRKLLISVIALVVTLAMAVTSTYAWFTTNTYATVEGFDVNVKTESDEGLFVMIDSPTYTSGFVATLSSEDILAAIRYNVNSGAPTDPQLKPLTTTNRTVFYELGSGGVIKGDGTLTASETPVAQSTGYYATFTLVFQSTKEGVIVLVGDVDDVLKSMITASDGSTATGRSMTAWNLVANDGLGTAGADYDGIYKTQSGLAEDYATGSAVPLRAFNAARVTFDSQTGGDTEVVWAPNAIKDAVQVGYYENAYDWTVQFPADYKQSTESNEVTLVSVDSGTGGAADTLSVGTTIATLEQEEGASTYTATVVIYIWLDGNDGSCINNISGDSFQIDLVFRRANAS